MERNMIDFEYFWYVKPHNKANVIITIAHTYIKP